MKNLLGVAIVAAVVGAVAGYVSQIDFRVGTKKVVNANIFFYGSPGACKAKVSPDPITAEKNYAIDWTIVDLCGLAVSDVVTLNWIENANNGAAGPNPLENLVTVPKKRIKGDLKGNVDVGNRFTYQIWLNGTAVADPDVEIVQY